MSVYKPFKAILYLILAKIKRNLQTVDVIMIVIMRNILNPFARWQRLHFLWQQKGAKTFSRYSLFSVHKNISKLFARWQHNMFAYYFTSFRSILVKYERNLQTANVMISSWAIFYSYSPCGSTIFVRRRFAIFFCWEMYRILLVKIANQFGRWQHSVSL